METTQTVTFTRKVTLFFREEDEKKKEAYFKKIKDYAYVTRQVANYVTADQYWLKKQYQLEKLITPDWSGKLADRKVNEAGVLTSSAKNVTYRVVSEKFKGRMPSAAFSATNNRAIGAIKWDPILKGHASLPSYTDKLPIELPKQQIYNMKWEKGKKEISFDAYGSSPEGKYYLPFITYMGDDKSGNRTNFRKIMSGEYQICDSSIEYYRKETTGKPVINLLLVIKKERNKINLNPNRVLGMNIGMVHPVVTCSNESDRPWFIGITKELLYKRQQIQEKIEELQKHARYNKGGKGRKKKIDVLIRFRKKERHFAQTRNHQYSREVVNQALRNDCGVILIEDFTGINKAKAKNREEHPEADKSKFVLRNWAYFELQNFIAYKAKEYGIKVLKVSPAYMSQKCKKCGHVHGSNRIGLQEFKCTACGYEEKADSLHAWNMARIDLSKIDPENIKEL